MKIRGNTVGFPNPQSDWNQTDTSQADYIKNKPGIEVDADGYTNISGLRQGTAIDVVKTDKTIKVVTTLEGDKATTSIINLNKYGYPTSIVTDGVECIVSWEGFE